MSLLQVHRLLIGCALALAVILVVWGVVHGISRRETGGLLALVVGALGVPAATLYLRKIARNPPIKI